MYSNRVIKKDDKKSFYLFLTFSIPRKREGLWESANISSVQTPELAIKCFVNILILSILYFLYRYLLTLLWFFDRLFLKMLLEKFLGRTECFGLFLKIIKTSWSFYKNIKYWSFFVGVTSVQNITSIQVLFQKAKRYSKNFFKRNANAMKILFHKMFTSDMNTNCFLFYKVQ